LQRRVREAQLRARPRAEAGGGEDDVERGEYGREFCDGRGEVRVHGCDVEACSGCGGGRAFAEQHIECRLGWVCGERLEDGEAELACSNDEDTGGRHVQLCAVDKIYCAMERYERVYKHTGGCNSAGQEELDRSMRVNESE
jgi:hypothetical protein